jgi:hypothetical protein
LAGQLFANCTRPSVNPEHSASSEDVSMLPLVLKLCRGASYKGSDVALAGPTGTSETWPRKPIPSGWWEWKTLLAYRFKHLHGAEHINALELRAVLSMLKCRSTTLSMMNQRVLHLLDSQVCLGVLAKGRSSSLKLSRILQQIASIQLAANILILGAYVSTDDNPADEPSRALQRVRKRKR